MNYFIFLAYYLITTLILFLIIYLIFIFICRRKAKQISLEQEKILEDFFDKM